MYYIYIYIYPFSGPEFSLAPDFPCELPQTDGPNLHWPNHRLIFLLIRPSLPPPTPPSASPGGLFHGWCLCSLQPSDSDPGTLLTAPACPLGPRSTAGWPGSPTGTAHTIADSASDWPVFASDQYRPAFIQQRFQNFFKKTGQNAGFVPFWSQWRELGGVHGLFFSKRLTGFSKAKTWTRPSPPVAGLRWHGGDNGATENAANAHQRAALRPWPHVWSSPGTEQGSLMISVGGWQGF